ncbi:MAG TPA: nicotinate (nicotinamide) nucleotide adenylyltransferase [Candidatus Fournierella merdavium]|mgnify:FL=1|nr:nicotinate (nicotinamide) nucleotide adenylyltransferase [Candidatus Fournierella merdavium]
MEAETHSPRPGGEKVLLFGGTFDPPHNGHVHFLKSAIRAAQPDRVVVMPACIPPHKAASATPAALRLAMCECFRPLFPALEVSDWEIRQGGKSYTIDTVKMLEEKYPGASVYLCVGSDMLTTFTEWRNWQELLRRTTLVAQSREEGDMPALRAAARALEAEGGRVLFTDTPALPLASTDLRAHRRDLSLVPGAARRVIEENHLYER